MDTVVRWLRRTMTNAKIWLLFAVGLGALAVGLAALGLIGPVVMGLGLLIAVLSWIAGVLGMGSREHIEESRDLGRQLLRESAIAAVWAMLYALPVFYFGNWGTAIGWWLVVLFIESERYARVVRQRESTEREYRALYQQMKRLSGEE